MCVWQNGRLTTLSNTIPCMTEKYLKQQQKQEKQQQYHKLCLALRESYTCVCVCVFMSIETFLNHAHNV